MSVLVRGVKISASLKKLVRFFVKIRTGISATCKFSDGLRQPTTIIICIDFEQARESIKLAVILRVTVWLCHNIFSSQRISRMPVFEYALRSWFRMLLTRVYRTLFEVYRANFDKI